MHKRTNSEVVSLWALSLVLPCLFLPFFYIINVLNLISVAAPKYCCQIDTLQ